MEFSKMSQTEMLIFGILGAAVLVSLIKHIRLMFKVKINAAAFMAQIKKLIDAKNVDRAIKLSSVAQDALLCRGTKAVLETWQGGNKDSYSLRESFERGAGVGGVDQYLKKPAWAPPLALVFVAAGVYLIFSSGIQPHNAHWGMAGAAVFLVIISYVTQSRIKKESLRARDELVEKLTS